MNMNTQKGFTLIELMVTIAVLAVVLSIGIPSFNTLINNNRVASQINRFVVALNYARSEAIKRREDISITAVGGDWSQGWNVTDTNANVLRTQEAFRIGSTLTGTQTSLSYDSRGFLSGGAALTFNLCNADSQSGRQVSVAPGGRVNVVDLNCGG